MGGGRCNGGWSLPTRGVFRIVCAGKNFPEEKTEIQRFGWRHLPWKKRRGRILDGEVPLLGSEKLLIVEAKEGGKTDFGGESKIRRTPR